MDHLWQVRQKVAEVWFDSVAVGTLLNLNSGGSKYNFDTIITHASNLP
jgi:hypothetical protein